MPTLNLLSQSAPSKSVDENSAQMINMYLVQNVNNGKYTVNAFPTPGLTVFSTLPTNPVRAIFTEHGVTYVVSGNILYSVTSNGSYTSLGTLSTSSGFCKIQGINNELLIIDGSNGYSYNISGNSFSKITSTTYVSSIVMTAPGSNYSNPSVVITDSTGSGAAATATVAGGQITGVTITATGSGYTAPTVSFTDSTGTGATATAYTTTSSFNNNIQDIVCQDEFGLGIGQNSQQWYASDVSDLTTWPALSFASTTGNQNNLVAITSLYRYIWLFGNQTTEIWYNAGNQYFSFARRPDMYLEWGCAARSSLALGNNTLFFLGQSPTGGTVVCNIQNYNPVVISTDEINYQISTYSTVSDAIGFCYQQEGHEFYVLTFPTANVTWVYDITTSLWHQRSTNGNCWLPNCCTFNYGFNLVGDPSSGNIYKLDMTNFTDNGTAITRTITTHPFYQNGMQIYIDRLQIDFDQTPGSSLSSINLYVSRDGGNTFGSAKPAYPVQTSDGQWRCYWPRLGRVRTGVFKIQTTLNNKFIVLGAWSNYRTGEN